MKRLNPITTEYIRRFSVLILLSFFSWMFFYSPLDVYEIQVQNYRTNYQTGIVDGDIDPLKTSLEAYIVYEMKKPYTWSDRKHKIIELKGKSKEFLNQLLESNNKISSNTTLEKYRSPNKFWSANSYFFRSSNFPANFLSQTFLKHPDYLMIKNNNKEKEYFKLYKSERTFSLKDAPLFISHPLQNYAYILLIIAILIYKYIQRPNIPSGAASYASFNAVYLPDALSIFLWLGGWMLFFLPDDSAPMVVRYIFLLFFVVFSLAIVLPTAKYASSWYKFTEDSFLWSDASGVGHILIKDIVSIKPYKKQLPKWVAPLIILFGRGQPIATGAGMISMSSSPEIGMVITTKKGQKIQVMANYLNSNKMFTERFKELRKQVKKSKKDR